MSNEYRCETLADPNPAFHSNADPDTASQNNVHQDPQPFLLDPVPAIQ
jgi:hypothetical protein